jgi:hypothetical protein
MGMHSECLVTVTEQYDTISLLNVKYHGGLHVVVCVCEEVGKVLLRIPEGTGTSWKI